MPSRREPLQPPFASPVWPQTSPQPQPGTLKTRLMEGRVQARGASRLALAAGGLLSPLLLLAACAPEASVEPAYYYGQVEPVLQNRCVGCHTAGGMAPFPLDTYQEARDTAHSVLAAVQGGSMPPWPPSDSCVNLAEPRRLAAQELDVLTRWVDSGMPQGDPADHVSLEKTGNGLGTPDVVLTPAEPFVPNATEDEYRCFVMDPHLTEDKFLVATDYDPGNDALVHHIVLYEDVDGDSVARDAEDEREGYSCVGNTGETDNLGNWVPGDGADVLPVGTGMNLHAGSLLVMQVHYHARGVTPDPDLTAVSLFFSSDPTLLPADYIRIANTTFTIPAGSSEYLVTQDFRVPKDGVIWGAGNHMHLLGQSIQLELEPKSGMAGCLLRIPKWDFGWQGNYFFSNPVAVRGGDNLRLSCIYDNSSGNPNNPNNPPQDVSWGESSSDEMCVGSIYYVVNPEETETDTSSGAPGPSADSTHSE